MPTLRTYSERFPAQHAADFLRTRGIRAAVTGDSDAFPGMGLHIPGARFAVILADAADLQQAGELLDSFEAEPAIDPGWESEAAPDLSMLDPRTIAPCPKCGKPLPLDASIKACPACRAPSDVTQVLLDRYGPDLLAACYPEELEEIPDSIVDGANLSCPNCQYSLRGLAAAGTCPECGGAYDKKAMLGGRPAAESTCAACGYSLTGLPTVGVCPECAHPYFKAGGPPRRSP